MRMRLFAAAAVCFMYACGGSSSPTAPTPTPPVATPAPPPVTPAPTAPATTPTLIFTPQTASPVGAAIAMFPGSRGQEAGKVSIAVTAHNLSDLTTIYGTIRYDATLLEYDNWGEGDWFKQGPGSPVIEWTFFPTLALGEIRLALQRTSAGLPGATGSGEIILFRFRPKAGVRSGTTTLRWDGPSLRGQDRLRELPLNNVYGGTITIQ